MLRGVSTRVSTPLVLLVDPHAKLCLRVFSLSREKQGDSLAWTVKTPYWLHSSMGQTGQYGNGSEDKDWYDPHEHQIGSIPMLGIARLADKRPRNCILMPDCMQNVRWVGFIAQQPLDGCLALFSFSLPSLFSCMHPGKNTQTNLLDISRGRICFCHRTSVHPAELVDGVGYLGEQVLEILETQPPTSSTGKVHP